MDLPPPPFVSTAAKDLAGWVALFDPAELPVLADTAAALEEWRANEDMVDAHMLAEVIGRDPLMSLKLLAHVARHCRGRTWDDEQGGVETITAALVLMGIGPFFRVFGPQPVAEEWLADIDGAVDGFAAVLRRSHRASAFALAFAAHRMDPDASIIHEAALLHDFAELLLWLRAPALAQQLMSLQRHDRRLRSAHAQQQVLGLELPDLQHELMLRWRLPRMLIRITDDRHQDDPQVRNVLLAIRVARHSALDWEDEALPDDLADLGALLQLGLEPVRRLLLDIDAPD